MRIFLDTFLGLHFRLVVKVFLKVLNNYELKAQMFLGERYRETVMPERVLFIKV